ncbi:PhzF family phenazine biosynthesis protein [Xanthobacter tagetidis]|jgi:trans-2,3-dihydro-3-hydroxyanthranilate isomerase|uniref:PhzF family phenazine biosynthesis protein n=1 Tax=Xanthobacter tagetidis TaxID=60216 RepID=A0A3L7A5D8_9HYPH|nr:PhzF family phenazine biosynthesis protein [Xanthobacter tagetidis]MBB6308739.1 trans-2,3-dihydro-3-hydroxyanthranilate isomerase [Xanthobacter tagetidis]RLP75447.1 PhzF family phenazine biosynthesis protein [Xanthobacter tagetidis]
MPRRYVTLDVFTTRPFGGNPLAVVLDAQGMDEAAMQQVAREFNVSETVFVLPPKNPANKARIRIFTVAHEMPFAGHPTVGAAVLLALEGKMEKGSFTIEEQIGTIKCEVATQGPGSRKGSAVFTAPRKGELEEVNLSRAACADALSLEPSDIGFDAHRPVVASAGVPFLFVPLSNLTALARARPDEAAFIAALGAFGEALYLYTPDEEGDADFRARMFSPGLGTEEDPATGAAAAAFPTVLMDAENRVDGHHKVRIDQGFEMGRPSRLDLGFTVKDGQLVEATIGGGAVVIAEGVLHV